VNAPVIPPANPHAIAPTPYHGAAPITGSVTPPAIAPPTPPAVAPALACATMSPQDPLLPSISISRNPPLFSAPLTLFTSAS